MHSQGKTTLCVWFHFSCKDSIELASCCISCNKQRNGFMLLAEECMHLTCEVCSQSTKETKVALCCTFSNSYIVRFSCALQISCMHPKLTQYIHTLRINQFLLLVFHSLDLFCRNISTWYLSYLAKSLWCQHKGKDGNQTTVEAYSCVTMGR